MLDPPACCRPVLAAVKALDFLDQEKGERSDCEFSSILDNCSIGGKGR